METLLLTLHFLVCLVLIIVVLLQRGRGQGMGAALGGGGGDTVFGSRGAGNFLTKLTTASAIVFMVTSLSLSYLGYEEGRIELFDDSVAEDAGTLEEVPADAAASPEADAGETGGLQEIPQPGADAGAPSGGGLQEIPQAADGADTGTPAP